MPETAVVLEVKSVAFPFWLTLCFVSCVLPQAEKGASAESCRFRFSAFAFLSFVSFCLS